MTVDDLLALPSDARAELIDGNIVHLPPPLPEHGRAQRTIGRFIGGPFDDDHGRGGPGGWWILPEVEVRVAGEIVRPDASGWSRERLPSPWGMRPIEVVPDWICEALSPSNEGHDRVYKANIYAMRAPEFGSTGCSIRPSASSRRSSCATTDGLASARGTPARRRGSDPFGAIELEVDRLFPPA